MDYIDLNTYEKVYLHKSYMYGVIFSVERQKNPLVW